MRISNVSLFIFSLCLSACNYNHLKQSQDSAEKSRSEKMTSPDFASVQRAVIGPKCLSCHANETGNKGGTNLETYPNVRRLINRISFRALEKMDMPTQAPLSKEEALILKTWLDMGAPETALDTQGAEDPSLEQGPTDWLKINQKVFGRKCLDCHSQPDPKGNLDLNSYEEVKLKATLIFDRVIIKQDMPIEPYPTLSVKERKVLLNWLNMGMPQ